LNSFTYLIVFQVEGGGGTVLRKWIAFIHRRRYNLHQRTTPSSHRDYMYIYKIYMTIAEVYSPSNNLLHHFNQRLIRGRKRFLYFTTIFLFFYLLYYYFYYYYYYFLKLFKRMCIRLAGRKIREKNYFLVYTCEQIYDMKRKRSNL
jgi:hypothetical protein